MIKHLLSPLLACALLITGCEPSEKVGDARPAEDLARSQSSGPSAEFMKTLNAARKGNANAQYWIGMHYDLSGVRLRRDQDYSEARKWFEKAAAQNKSSSLYMLGLYCEYGRGVPKDLSKAAEYYDRAANVRDYLAQLRLGKMYRSGIGVNRDLVQARKWMLLAKESSALQSAERQNELTGELELVTGLMTADEIESSARLARDFRYTSVPR